MESENLRDLSPEEQVEALEEWFRDRYEDPAEHTPYSSADGGYQWIWGGPYDAEEVLREEFEGVVPDTVIMEAVETLQNDCSEWAPRRLGEYDYDEGLLEAVSSNTKARQTLDEALETIRSLLAIDVTPALAAAHVRLLYANAITALETYLSDTFINHVLADPELLQKYLDNEPAFRDKKIPQKDVLREAQNINEAAKLALLDTVWHNIAKVKPLYYSVLDVNVGSMDAIGAAIQIRHDIVHRNGRGKDGRMVAVSRDDVLALIEKIVSLANAIEVRLNYGFQDETE